LLLTKQSSKAKAHLKTLNAKEWKFENGDDFERMWLLLGDIYVQSGKMDNATTLLNQCLKYNSSCTKAHEYLGYIKEKQQVYSDAAEHYERAFKCDQELNPSMGYKLAFNYLKSKRYMEAIDIGNEILQKYPEYPKIQSEIIDKARWNIKIN
jgi:tetratricopeptide repeat protein 21B